MTDPTHPTDSKGATGTLGDFVFNNLKTPAVKNIEAAWSRAGASNHHTPGYATKLGSQDQQGANAPQGVGSKKFADSISDQRQEPSVVGKVFNNLMNGTDFTK